MRAKRKRYQGRIVFNEPRQTYNLLWREGEKHPSHKLGTPDELPEPEDRERAAERFWKEYTSKAVTVEQVHAWYWQERAPDRASTRRQYESVMRVHILPRWGRNLMRDLQPQPVEGWLKTLVKLAPITRKHLREAIRVLWEHAMWRGSLPREPNPMDQVIVKDSTIPLKKQHSLNHEEFGAWIHEMARPEEERAYLVFAMLSLPYSLRASEGLALKWLDMNWLEGTLYVRRGIVKGVVDELKTRKSRKRLTLAPVIVSLLREWKAESMYQADEDWIFASPYKDGKEPYSYDVILLHYKQAAERAGIVLEDENGNEERLGTHALRHSARAWFQANKETPEAQREALRKTSLDETFRTYGQMITPEATEAQRKVAEQAMEMLHSGKVISRDFRVQ